MWILVLLVGFMLDTGTAPAAEHVRARGVWVTRWDFKNAGDVARIFKNVKELGATQVFFQVRGNATVCYPSRIEPWAWELTGITPATLGKDPGWDPLAVAIEEAAKNHVELHAWMNVFPGWRGVEPIPKGFKHPWADKRSWFMVDHRGVLMRPTGTFYTFMSPGHPAVREYLASVFGEIAQLYPALDGIHLDYVRYPGNRELGSFRDFSYDEASVAAFQKIHKKKPLPDMDEWRAFKREQVTETIRAIRNAIRLASPIMRLSATCFAEIHSATAEKGQDPRVWLREDLVDWVTPMAYKRSQGELKTLLNNWNSWFDEKALRRMSIGLNADFNNADEVRRQLEYIDAQNYGGVIEFAYASLFVNHQPNAKAGKVQEIWREQMVQEKLLKPATQAPAASSR